MALKLNERYPGRFDNPTTSYPQGSFKNRSAPGAQDGSYLEKDWANDVWGLFGRLLTVAGITPNGSVDTALASQYYDALTTIFARNSSLGVASTRNVATNEDMQTGTSTQLLTTVANIISLFPVRTFTDSDYIRIPDRPGGLIIQWRKNITDGSSSGNLHTFPTPFPNQLLFVVPVDLTTSSSANVAPIAVDYVTSTLTAAKIFVSSGNNIFSMLAFGR